jgi:hypothetical protein
MSIIPKRQEQIIHCIRQELLTNGEHIRSLRLRGEGGVAHRFSFLSFFFFFHLCIICLIL